MKERLTNNLGLKLISVFCAFFVWLAVVNVANPVKVETKEVPVDIINSNILSEKNMTYEIDGKKTATVTYKVKTKDAYRIKTSDFRAYADLSEMYDVTGAIPIKVEVLSHEELLVSSPTVKAPGVIKITTENLQTKRFDLGFEHTGAPAKGYAVGETELTPNFVYVKGPVSQVGQISSIGIRFSVEGATDDVAGITEPIFFDANGNELNLGEKVTVLSNEIAYQMVMLKVKEVGLDFAVTGEVAEGYRFTGVETDVKNVSVAGLKSVLASISTMTIQDPILNVDGATADKVCTINLDQYLAPNVTIVGLEDHTIKVVLKVEALKDETFTLNTKDILMEGAADDYEYEYSASQILVTVSGLEEDLDSLTPDSLAAAIQVGNLEPGTYSGILSFNLDDSFHVKSYTGFDLTVTEKNQPTAQLEDGETSTSDTETEESSQTAEAAQVE